MNARRARARANGPAGLWRDLPGQGPVPAHQLPPDQQASPRRRPCPSNTGCGANPGEPCTRPSRRGRVPLKGYHHSRLTSADPSESETQENP